MLLFRNKSCFLDESGPNVSFPSTVWRAISSCWIFLCLSCRSETSFQSSQHMCAAEVSKVDRFWIWILYNAWEVNGINICMQHTEISLANSGTHFLFFSLELNAFLTQSNMKINFDRLMQYGCLLWFVQSWLRGLVTVLSLMILG